MHLTAQFLPISRTPSTRQGAFCARPHTCVTDVGKGAREDSYGKTIDRIGVCRRAGFQRRGGRCNSSRRATAYGSRASGATAQPYTCLDLRISPLGWQRLRLDWRQVGATAAAGQSLGSASLGSPEGRLRDGGRALAVDLLPEYTPHAGRWAAPACGRKVCFCRTCFSLSRRASLAHFLGFVCFENMSCQSKVIACRVPSRQP